MKWLRQIMDKGGRYFEPGAPLEKMYPLFEAVDTLFFTPSDVAKGPTHVRDGIDLKRTMGLVVLALLPCVAMAMYNTGYQANLAIAGGAQPLEGIRSTIYQALGLAYSPTSIVGCFVHGALYFVPIFVVGFGVGISVEVVFSIIRKHEVNEGFFVTGFLYPLILPATTPLWQVALGIAFGILLGKEIFGGTGMNILNPALVARAFLFFAYPAQLSGNVWTAADVDATTGASALAVYAESGTVAVSWMTAFFGRIQGSMGETSAFLCAVGAVLLIVTRVASWRIMAGVTIGSLLTVLLLNLIGSETNPMLNMPVYWHFVLGGWAFGTVFMATDPVTAATTPSGKWVFGLLIGVLVILIRCVNPAYPEGMMLAILFMNLFAPLIDHVVMRQNIKRRKARYEARPDAA